MAEIVARRLVEHLECAGFVVMKRPEETGGAALGRGYEANDASSSAMWIAIVMLVEWPKRLT
jgi:hypothetical protein